jgi:hypothetical protein
MSSGSLDIASPPPPPRHAHRFRVAKSMTRAAGKLLILSAMGLLALAGDARAANINTPAGACHAIFPEQQANISYFPSGLQQQSSQSVPIMCPIPRSPLAGGSTAGTFFIDGKTAANSSTSCTMAVYNFTGGPVSFFSFTEQNTTATPKTFDHFVSVPAAQLTAFVYASVTCELTAGSWLFGVTSVQ